jgi:putative MATE family efflux protein
MNSDDKKRYLILKDPNIYKGLIILSLPLMFNNLIRTFHDLIDMFFVSKIDGYASEAIASIGITFPITFTYISLGMGLSVAGTALISQLYGSGQFERSKEYATHLVVIALILGLIMNVFGFVLAEPIMKLMGAEGFTLLNSVAYLKIRSFELPFLFLFFAFTAIRQSSGDTISPVILGVIAMVLNSILSPIFISVLDYGVQGAAIATVVANIVIMPYGIVLLFKSKTGVHIKLTYAKLKKDISKEIIQTAIPASLGQAITAIGFGVLNAFILSYGENTTAAFNIGNRIASMFLHPVMAIGGVLSAYIGQNIGNLNPERAKDTFKKGLRLSLVLMSVMAFIGFMVREPIAAIFLKDNPFALDLAITYMYFLFLGLPLMAIFQTFIGVYNGNGKTNLTFWLGVTRLWLIRIPLILFFKNFTNLGSSGIWYAMLSSNVIIALLGTVLYKLFITFEPKVNVSPEVAPNT